VLSLWKLRVGVEAYYLSQVASGLDDYYHGTGEAPGEWVGNGCPAMGVSGQVAAHDLQAILAGLRPGTGLTPNGTTLTTNARRVPGYDLTFSVPKSVSVIYALGDPRIQAAAIEAGEAATRSALGWLEREACFVRRGSNDQNTRHTLGDNWGTRRQVASGFVTAMFRHRTSRAGDPQLHWHVLVANIAQGSDGRWSALDGYAIYRAKRAAGVIFQVALRRELSQRLGVEWGPQRTDIAEVAGIPRRVQRLFSTRRQQIEEWLEEHGRTGPVAAQEATLATRTAKTDIDPVALDAAWKQQAADLGWGPAELETLLAHTTPTTTNDSDDQWLIPAQPSQSAGGSGTPERVATFDEWIANLLDARLTANDSTFDRNDLTQGIAAALPSGVSVQRVEQVVALALTSDQVIPVAGAAEARAERDTARYTSRGLIELENAFRTNLAAIAGTAVRSIDPTGALAARQSLGDDQRAVVTAITGSTAGVHVLVGHAGTGKTYTLGAVREAFETAGYTVVGLAPSARAARELEDGSGIESHTIAAWRHRNTDLTNNTLVVVDEAAMVGTRDLVAIVQSVAASRARLLLVGDHHQLAEVSAGGGFEVALAQLGPMGGVSELTVNRRQRQAWEHEALEQLRHGDIATAWAIYKRHDAVEVFEQPDAMRTRLLTDWMNLHNEGDGDVVMLTGTRAQSAAMNRLARRSWNAAGRLSGPTLNVDGRLFQVGERIVCLRNDPSQTDAFGNPARVDNGMVGTIVALDSQTAAATIALKGSCRRIVLHGEYVRGGWLDYGYAMTVHKAQGVTCDHVLVVGPDGLNREGIYVALSRARHSARLYATARQEVELVERHGRGIPLPSEAVPDATEDLLARLHRSGRKQFATAIDPDAAVVAGLADRYTGHQLALRVARTVAIAQSGADLDPTDIFDRYERAVVFRGHAETGRRVRTGDRGNVGIIDALDDGNGTAEIVITSPDGRSVTRRFDWDQLLVIDEPSPVLISPEAARWLDAFAGRAAGAEALWSQHLARHGLEPGDRERYRRALDLVIDRATQALIAGPPVWLDDMLGARPTDSIGATTWDDTVHQIAAWRTTHGVSAHQAGLGNAPTAVVEYDQWSRLSSDVIGAQAWLTVRPDPTPESAHRQLSPEEIAARLAELAEIVAAAPPADVGSLAVGTTGGEPGADLAVLPLVATSSDARTKWILEHWPNLVEQRQLGQLSEPEPSLPSL
jgi:conjugative relaxase-like TrwC/TraI family protein